MLDIKFVRDNPDAVKENIKKKFQDAKLPLVDEVIEKDAKYRECLKEVEVSQGRPQQAEQGQRPAVRPAEEVRPTRPRRPSCRPRSTPTTPPSRQMPTRWPSWRLRRASSAARIQEIMYTIPQMIDPSVPIGPGRQL